MAVKAIQTDSNRRLGRWLTMLAAGALLLAGPALAATESQTFDVGAGGRLKIDTDIGSIEVSTGTGDQVAATVTWSGSNADEFTVDFSQDGDRVTIEGDFDRGLWGWGSSPKVRFEVTVPERFDVDLETSGGSISVDDLEGEVRARTSGGSLSFGQIDGPVYGRTSGGSISLQGSRGNADISTSGGSIKIGDVDGEVTAKTSGGSIQIARARGAVDAKTSGGSITVEEVMGAIQASTSGGSVTAYIGEQPAGDCRLTTSGGGVNVYLADDVAVDVDAKASGGRAVSEFDLDAARVTKTALSGEINGGGPALYLRSSGGSVRIKRR